MKRLFTIIAILTITNALTQRVSAQTFNTDADTVWITNPANGIVNTPDSVGPVSGCVTLQWRVITNTFPTDWTWGFCDNIQCYGSSLIWPMTVKKTHSYCSKGDFHLQMDLDAATTTGTYMLQVKVNDSANVSNTKTETFIVTKQYRTEAPVVRQVSTDVVLYPNPASDEINLVYDAGLDIKNIAVYNIIGKMMSVYKVAGNSANISISNVPSGIYIVRLVNSQGNIVATKKFTKQ